MSRFSLSVVALGLAAASVTALGACADSTGPGTGTLMVRLTDAPFSSDSVSRVDVYVVRVDTKTVDTDSADAAHAVTDDSVAAGGWTTIAAPNRSIELLALRNGLSTALGGATLPAGSYRNFRLVIDPSKSSVTLKNGQVLTSTSMPNVSFPSAARSGIKLVITRPIVVTEGDTATTLIDFDVNNSFVMRSGPISSSGLTFKPVIRGTVQ